MFNLKNTLAAAAIILAAVGTANASEIVLDSFNYDPVIDLTVNSTGGVWIDGSVQANVDSPNGGVLASTLLLKTDNGNPNSEATSNSFINGSSGELSFNNGSGVSSELGLFYTS
jgi:hypothetical protein